MDLKELIHDDDAVSPVIGVILMVAITVILAAVIASFVLGLGDQASSTTPQASFSFDYAQDGSGHDELTVTHDGGDTLEHSNINASVDDAATHAGTDLTFGSAHASGDGDLYTGNDVAAGSTDTLDETQFHNGANDMSTIGEDLDLSETTVKVVYSAPSGDNSAVLATWEGPDA